MSYILNKINKQLSYIIHPNIEDKSRLISEEMLDEISNLAINLNINIQEKKIININVRINPSVITVIP